MSAADGRRSGHVRPPLPKAKRTGFLNVDAFAGELVEIRDGDILPQPHLHVFSLSDFRSAVGAKWERLGGLVEVAVESIIRRHVNAEKDIFTRLDAEIACLALPNASRSETRTMVAAIARDISAHLFGDAVIDGRRPQVLAANLPLDDALTDGGEMDREAIDHALARAGAALAEGLAAMGAAGGMAAPYRAQLSSLMTPEDAARMEAEAAREKKKGYAISGGERAKMAEPDWLITEERASPSSTAKRGADAERRVLDMSKERKEKAPEQVMRIEGRGGSALTPDTALTLVWTPTWVTGRRAIGAFHARVIRSDKDNTPTLEGVHAYDGLQPIEALTLDRFTVTQTARELKSLFYSRQKIGLTLPVNWMSLSPKWRDVIRIPFEDCPVEARRKFLKIEVFGLTPGIPAHVLRRVFEPLEKIGCDVMARLPLTAVDMIPALSHLRAVGVDLAELADDERVGDDDLFARLEVFRLEAKKAKVATYVWGVRRRPLIAKLVEAGFSLINGPGVMCDLSHPELPSKANRKA
ncbi:hypothetical protein CU669_17340 [Paramagnetospirillum kuznetsovii]|uniref:EAL domain-containing protein n=1 Tax=Paramagnetospirillum kuznetsovii TaxID=2053833 RepID=A0A364NU30_9PROT|nr:hypothetical protein [Paramagnetospirillum kuznetsovii]RAU20599.1 hypothetical protein CU669_17340 [Paramagnetospirillum kuznetsovii]